MWTADDRAVLAALGLGDLLERHRYVPEGSDHPTYPYFREGCADCGIGWPCDVVRALAACLRLAPVVAAARAWHRAECLYEGALAVEVAEGREASAATAALSVEAATTAYHLRAALAATEPA